MMKRNKFTLLLVTVIVLAGACLSSCLSKEKRELKKSVEEYESTLPQNVAPGVSVSSVSYDSDSDKVILTCNFENETVAQSVGLNSAMLKAAFVPYLRHAKAGNQFITNMINADATLVCDFCHGDRKIATFEVTADEIK